MGDRDYYLLDDEASLKMRNAYKNYISTLFTLAGYSADEAAKAADAVMKFETGIAETSVDRNALRDVHLNYNKMSLKDFVRKYLKIKESDISNILKLDDSSPFVIADKKFKTSLQKIIMPSYNVQRQDSKGQFITRKLLNAYITNPHQLPDQYLLRIFKVEIPRTLEPDQLNTLFEQLNHTLQRNFLLWDAIDARNAINTISQSTSGYELLYPLLFRTIFDYISGMTDSFAQEEYRRLY